MTTAATSPPHRYQRWSGQLKTGCWTWSAITRNGISQAFKNPKTRGLLTLTAGSVVFSSCVIFYLLSMLETLVGTPEAQGLYQFVHTVLKVDISDVSRIEELREVLWRSVFMLMMKVELFWVMFVVARVGPGLIATDLKFRALPIYFAKPVTPLTYLVGKWLVVVSFIAMVLLVPNLLSVTIGTLITGGLQTWSSTLDLGFDLLVCGVGVCAFGGAVMLALSSLSSDYRFVTVAWLAVCVVPAIAQAIIFKVLPEESTTTWLGCISLRENVMILTDWMFGMRDMLEASPLPAEAFSRALVRPVRPFCAVVVLGVWTVIALWVCHRRVVRFSRAAASV